MVNKNCANTTLTLPPPPLSKYDRNKNYYYTKYYITFRLLTLDHG